MKKKKVKVIKQRIKQYQVKIEFSYLLKADTKEEAITRSMDRFRGRTFTGVYFDGMIVNADLTERVAPVHCSEMPKRPDDMTEFNGFGNEGGKTYGIKLNGDRKDSKEQDYIHFDPADEV